MGVLLCGHWQFFFSHWETEYFGLYRTTYAILRWNKSDFHRVVSCLFTQFKYRTLILRPIKSTECQIKFPPAALTLWTKGSSYAKDYVTSIDMT